MADNTLEFVLKAQDKMSAALEGINKKLKGTQQGMTKAVIVGNLFAVAIQKAIGVVTSWGKQVIQQVHATAEYSQSLKNLSITTGLSTQRLQEFQSTARQLNIDSGSLTMAFRTLNRQMFQAGEGSLEATKAFNRLGISVTDSTGNLRNAEQVFDEATNVLRQMSNPTERNALALQLFGRNAQQLLPYISATNEETAEMKKVMEDTGVIIDEVGQQKLRALNTAMDGSTEATKGFWNILSVQLAPAFTVFEKIQKTVIETFTRYNKETDIGGSINLFLIDTLISASEIFGNLSKVIQFTAKILRNFFDITRIGVKGFIGGLELISQGIGQIGNLWTLFQRRFAKESARMMTGQAQLFATSKENAKQLAESMDNLNKSTVQTDDIYEDIQKTWKQTQETLNDLNGDLDEFWKGLGDAPPEWPEDLRKAFEKLKPEVDALKAKYTAYNKTQQEGNNITAETAKAIQKIIQLDKQNLDNRIANATTFTDYWKASLDRQLFDYGFTMDNIVKTSMQMVDNLTKAVGEGFYDVMISKTKEWKDVFNDFGKSILKSITDLMAQEVVKKFLGLFGIGGTGGGGGVSLAGTVATTATQQGTGALTGASFQTGVQGTTAGAAGGGGIGAGTILPIAAAAAAVAFYFGQQSKKRARESESRERHRDQAALIDEMFNDWVVTSTSLKDQGFSDTEAKDRARWIVRSGVSSEDLALLNRTGDEWHKILGQATGLGYFAKGGIATKPILGMVGEAGSEAIIPLEELPSMMGNMAMAGANININIYEPYIDSSSRITELVTKIEKKLIDKLKINRKF